MRYGAEHKKEKQRFSHKNLNEQVENYAKITIEMYIIKYIPRLFYTFCQKGYTL